MHHVLYLISSFRNSNLATRNRLSQNVSASRLMSKSSEDNPQAHLNRLRRGWLSTTESSMERMLGEEAAYRKVFGTRDMPALKEMGSF